MWLIVKLYAIFMTHITAILILYKRTYCGYALSVMCIISLMRQLLRLCIIGCNIATLLSNRIEFENDYQSQLAYLNIGI